MKIDPNENKIELILEKYHEIKDNKSCKYLQDPTPANIRNKLINLFSTNQLNTDQKNTIKNFLNKKEGDDLLKAIKVNIDVYKPIQYLFQEKTKQIKKIGLIEISELLVGIKKEIVPNEKNEEKKEFTSSNENKFLITLFIALCVVAITISGFYLFNQEGDTNIDVGGVEINNDFRQITPTKETRFFSKENEQPLVWYVNYNNQLDFFNARGKHPITGKVLLPVTKELVRTHFIERIPIESLNGEKNIIETNKGSIINQTVIAILNKNQLDVEFGVFFKKEYRKIIENYTCNGSIKYFFRKSNISKKLTICELVLTYTVTSNNTLKELDSNIIKTTGPGFTENEAKQKAISAIKF